MMAGSIKHIYFDWNGTLLDDIHAVHESINRILARDGHRQFSLDDFQRHYENRPFELYTNMGLTPEQIEHRLRADAAYFHDHYEALAETALLRPGTNGILRFLKSAGFKSHILSNHLLESIHTRVVNFEIRHLVEDVLAYESRAVQFKDMSKSERLAAHMAKHGLKPEDVMIVGDSKEEVQIGHERGIVCVAITGGCVSEARLRAEKPDYIIHHLSELNNIVSELRMAS